MDLQQQKMGVALLSVISNSMLVVLKLIVGLAIGSVSVISEAIHSGVDLIAAIIALFAVRTAGKPADKDHPYGHGKYENISGTVEALLIFVAAAWIIYESVHKLQSPRPVEAAAWGAAVMLFSTVVNIIVSEMLFRIGRRADSAALKADAWHLRTDVFTSVGVMLALGAMSIGARIAPGAHLHWLDPAAAMAVALLIIRAAYQLTIESARDLLDVSLPPEEEAFVHDYVSGLAPEVCGYHHLRTRKSGHMRFIDLHLLVRADMHVDESHALAERVEHEIEAHFAHSSVTVHVEPCRGSCEGQCPSGCLLTDEEREVMRGKQEG